MPDKDSNKFWRRFERSIKNLLEYCEEQSNHFDFLSESDLKCFFYGDLAYDQKIETLKQVVSSRYKISPVHTELTYSFIGSGRKKCDLAIIDHDELGFKVDSKDEPYSYVFNDDYVKNSVVVELGYSWGDKSKGTIINALKKYCKKLDNKLKHRYVIYLDMSNNPKLEKSDIKKVTRKSIKIIYITRKGTSIKNFRLK